jgi:hypothetical protein
MRRVIDVESYRRDHEARRIADDLLARVGVPVDHVVELIIDDDEHGHAFVTVEQVVRPIELIEDDDGVRRLRHVTSTFEL